MMHSKDVLPGVPEGYELVWADEFDGNAVDPEKWCFKPLMKGQSDLKLYDDERAVQVKNGCMHLMSGRESDELYYTNTALTTADTMVFKHGYVEMCAKLPFSRPAFPSFWMQSSLCGAKQPEVLAEIDILEYFATEDPYIQTGIHKWYREGNKEHFLCPEVGQAHFKNRQIAEDWHRYALWWTEESLKFYVDGQLYHEIDITEQANFGEIEGSNMGCFHDYCYLIFNNYLMTKGFKSPPEKAATPEDEFPIVYQIDYVRLYQEAGKKDLLFPQAT